MKRIFLVVLILPIVLLGIVFLGFSRQKEKTAGTKKPQPTSTPAKIIYSPPQITPADSYTIILVGDSMTKALGPNSDKLREFLAQYYPDKVFGIFNYGFAATNVLSLQERLENVSLYEGVSFPAILDREFDLIIIESFGHNPLSQFSLTEGLRVQNQTLEKAVRSLLATHPNSIIVFLATIAPSRAFYAQGAVELSEEQRRSWAEERIAYIKNHLDYAQEHQIPLINVFETSLDDLGEANLAYIDQGDYIHPSKAGVALISWEIARYIFENRLLPP